MVLARRSADGQSASQNHSPLPISTDLGALRARWEDEDRLMLEYVQGLTAADLEGDVTYKWPQARPRTMPLWQILMHIYTHGVHHRSEIGRHLATLGESPGDLDFLKFVVRRG